MAILRVRVGGHSKLQGEGTNMDTVKEIIAGHFYIHTIANAFRQKPQKTHVMFKYKYM